MKDRVVAYDYIRLFAMLLVVACHSFGDVSNAGAVQISLLSYLESPCNGLFFAISGALLLPVKSMGGDFLKKRLGKVIVPTVLWSLIYLALAGDLSISRVLSILFSSQGAGMLWFMYTMIGLYILSPIISPWLERVDKKNLQFYLILWGITTCYPIIGNWLATNETVQGPLYYFSGYVGYFLLGYYLKKYGISFKLSACMFFLAFAVMIGLKIVFPSIALYDRFWFLSVFCITGVLFYWRLIEILVSKMSVGIEIHQIVITCSNLIFGVYFIHWGIIKYVIPMIFVASDGIPYLVGYFCRTVIAFVVALCLSYAISFIPGSQYIIGFKHK